MRPLSTTFALALLFATSPATAEVLVGRIGAAGTTEPNVISVFGDETSGDVAPDYLIGGPATGLETANGLSYDPDERVVVVADFFGQQVLVFAVTSRGDAAPLRAFSHPAMGQPRMAVAIPEHDEIAVADFAFVRYYPRDANGSTAPLRSTAFIPGVADNLSGLVYLAATDEVAVGDGYAPKGGGSAGEVLFFDRATPNASTTSRRIAGPLTRLGTFVLGLAHDPANEELFALTSNEDGSASIQVFSESADGNVAPIRSIEGAATLMHDAIGLSYYALRDELLVASGAFNSVPRLLGFPRLTSGNVAPSRNISGPATGVSSNDGWYGVVGVSLAHVFRDGFE